MKPLFKQAFSEKNLPHSARQNTKSKYDKKKTAFHKNKTPFCSTKTPFYFLETAFHIFHFRFCKCLKIKSNFFDFWAFVENLLRFCIISVAFFLFCFLIFSPTCFLSSYICRAKI